MEAWNMQQRNYGIVPSRLITTLTVGRVLTAFISDLRQTMVWRSTDDGVEIDTPHTSALKCYSVLGYNQMVIYKKNGQKQATWTEGLKHVRKA